MVDLGPTWWPNTYVTVMAVVSDYTGEQYRLPEPVGPMSVEDAEAMARSWQPILELDWHLHCEEMRQRCPHLPQTSETCALCTQTGASAT